MRRVDPRRLVFIDESGANTKMGRSHAWAIKGQERIEPRPINWGTNLTMIGAIRMTGPVLLRTMFATANGDRFVDWIRTLVRRLHPGDIVVMDNARAHHDPRVHLLIEGMRANLVYLPPYSPDFNPIEPAWANAKRLIRGVAPRWPDSLRSVARRAFRRIKPIHCRRWFNHAGYRLSATDLRD